MSSHNLSEQWRPVVGFEGKYAVSSLGRVRGRQKLLAPIPRPNGYLQVNLTDGSRRRCAMVHQLVLAAFVGPRPEGAVSCHNNGDSFDNRLENLRWDTQSSNLLDKRKHGTVPDYRGERHPQCKLSDAAVVGAIELRKSGWKLNDIAARIGVSKSYVSMLVRGIRRERV